MTVLLILLIALGFYPLAADSSEIGKAVLRNYPVSSYRAGTQNWAVAQDHRGVMYIGNNEGVLEYDAATWRLIPVSNRSAVRSLAVDAAGTVYVGAVGEFGYLAADSSGRLIYRSLTQSLDPESRNFADVWTTHVHRDTVYFQTRTATYGFRNGDVEVWHTGDSYHRGFRIDDHYFLRQDGVGLSRLGDDGVVPVSGGAAFADRYISAMLPFDDNTILVGTRKNGLFVIPRPVVDVDYDAGGDTMILPPTFTALNDYVTRHELYHGLMLPDGRIALCTITGGVVIADKNGDIQRFLNKTTGVQADTVHFGFVDRAGALWLALAAGIARVDIRSPFTYWDETAGLDGTIYGVSRYEGTIYAATDLGLEYLRGTTFTNVSGITTQTWSLRTCNVTDSSGAAVTRFLAGTSEGLFEIHGDSATPVLPKTVVFAILQPKSAKAAVLLGTGRGVVALDHTAGGWRHRRIAPHINDKIRSLAEDADGNLWLGTRYNGVVRVDRRATISPEAGSDPAMTIRYGGESGLPTTNNIRLYPYNDRLVFATEEGIYRFDAAQQRFLPDVSFGDHLADGSRDVYGFATVGDRVLVAGVYTRTSPLGFVTMDSEQRPQWNPTPFRLLPNMEIEAESLYADNADVVWIGGSEGLFRYDTSVGINNGAGFETVIRRVRSGADLILFDGAFFFDGNRNGGLPRVVDRQPETMMPILEYENNSLEFIFAGLSFKDVDFNTTTNTYRYRLLGYNDSWSPWTEVGQKEYTNLPEGDYEFHVMARNIYGDESDARHYRFTVMAPWYRTPAAYGGYLICFIAFVWGAAELNGHRLKRENQKLEALVAERAAKVSRQKDEIKKQNEELKRRSELIAAEKEKTDQLLNVVIPIGIALSSEQDFESLLDRILTESQSLCHADGATFYYSSSEKKLEFLLAKITSRGVVMGGRDGEKMAFPPIDLYIDGAPNNRSLAAYAAATGTSVNIADVYGDTSFDLTVTKEYDKIHNYRTQSVLAVPLKGSNGDVIGVLQLINASDPKAAATIPFGAVTERLIEAMSTLAAAMLQAYDREQSLRDEIQELRIEINVLKRDQEVKDVIEADFFKDILAQAEKIRNE